MLVVLVVGYVVGMVLLEILDLITRRRLERLIGGVAVSVAPTVEAEFKGVLRIGFEVQHVVVATGRRRLFFFPVFEEWSARFSSGFREEDLPPGTPNGSAEVVSYWIHFIGVPSVPGPFGHMGYCHREVHITRILAVRAMNDER